MRRVALAVVRGARIGLHRRAELQASARRRPTGVSRRRPGTAIAGVDWRRALVGRSSTTSAAGADPHGARAQLRRPASRRRGFSRRRRSSESRAPTSSRMSAAGVNVLGQRTRGRARIPAANVGAVEMQRRGLVGARLLGTLPPRHRSGARAAARDRMGTARRGDDARQPGVGALLRPARARPRARNLAADARVAAGVAAADRRRASAAA